MNAQQMTTDKLLETLAWIVARQRYRQSCKKKNGAAYAEECRAEAACMAELQRRGVTAW